VELDFAQVGFFKTYFYIYEETPADNQQGRGFASRGIV